MIVDITADLTVSASRADVEARIREEFLGAYDGSAGDFGATFPIANAYRLATVDNIPGLRTLQINKFTVDPYYGRYVMRPNENGSITGIWLDWTRAQRLEWFVRILEPDINNGHFCKRFVVRKRYNGKITGITSTEVTDETASFPDNSKVGWWFYPRPEELSDNYRWEVAANSSQTLLSAQRGVNIYAAVGDKYTVESDDGTGKVIAVTLYAGPSNSTTLTVDADVPGGTYMDLVAGDLLYFPNEDLYRTVLTVTEGIMTSGTWDTRPTITITEAVTAIVQDVHCVYVSSEGSLRFCVVDATAPTSFVVGDELYVDTYAASGDVISRDDVFLTLSNANLSISMTGGV
jgi:hypothetical protein